jgi:predicted nucleic acid-binding protein
MVILDTNVMSEIMHPGGAGQVFDWLDSQPRRSMFTTSISIFEIRSGISALPASQRRDGLERAFPTFILRGIGERVLPFDAASAEQASRVMSKRRALGRTIGHLDTLIAGIVIVHGAVLATRNVRDFDDLPLKLVNPWAAA